MFETLEIIFYGLTSENVELFWLCQTMLIFVLLNKNYSISQCQIVDHSHWILFLSGSPPNNYKFPLLFYERDYWEFKNVSNSCDATENAHIHEIEETSFKRYFQHLIKIRTSINVSSGMKFLVQNLPSRIPRSL